MIFQKYRMIFMLPELIMVVSFLYTTVLFKNSQHPCLAGRQSLRLGRIFYDRINYFQRGEAFDIFQHHTRFVPINAGINQVEMIGR